MREAINNNPMVQIAVIGVLVVIIGLFLMMSMGKKSPDATTAAPAPATAGTAAAGTTAPVTVPGAATAGAIAPSTAGAVPSVSSGSGTVTPDALIPGRGLPRNVVDAWKGGDAIALL